MLFEQAYVIVDLETTGGHITRDRITEIGLILVDGEKVERLEMLVNPGMPIPPFIEDMTGISNGMVADAPDFASLAPALLQKLEGRLFIAHNARFDYGFLKNAFRRVGLAFNANTLCSVKLSRRMYPQFFKHSLDSIIARHGIDLPARHRALADAEAVYRFLLLADQELGREVLLGASRALLAVPSVPSGMAQDLADTLPDMPGVYTLYAASGEALYVGRCLNLRQRIFAHYGSGTLDAKLPRIHESVAAVTWQETLGEFGAALLELRTLHALRPRYNPRACQASELCALQLAAVGEGGFLRVSISLASALDFSRTADLYGLFRSPREAKKALAELARGHKLCPAILGVETVTSRKGQPCVAFKSRRCLGACCAQEEALAHNARLKLALERLKTQSWPYAGAIAVTETDEVTGASLFHVFERWCYLGSGERADGLQGVPVFDLDIYRLLVHWLKKPVPGTVLHELATF
ncbi:exonuclease domain-containing protein [Craterilacuibacter sp.]|uniref:exonuclease domain-containing protein n=1 Tax=Craterilacuibacter sp. TaxID=2870909 RepID=UPI003F3A254F